jgi:acid phosphatase
VAADPSIQELQKQGILLNRYYAHTHPSQPNYLAALAGDYFGLNHDDYVRVPLNVSTVVDLLKTKHVSWRGYMENLPGPGYMGMGSPGQRPDDAYSYVRKHNPFVSYDSITYDGTNLLELQSFDEFQRDLAVGHVPQVCFMTPNMLNDGHDTGLKYATDWARSFLPQMLTDNAFAERTLILLTYDESEDYGKPNHIVSLLLGSAVPYGLRGTSDDTFYTHYSILSTLENNWDLPNLGRYDVGANVFQFVADATGYKNREPPNGETVHNSVSYPGFLNRDHSRQTALPPPNLKLVGAGGQGVLEDTKQQWQSTADEACPYDGSGAVYDGAKNLPVYKSQGPNVAFKDEAPSAR